MEAWCSLVLGATAILPQIVLWMTSRWLDGWAWWDNLPSDRKAELWAGGSLVLGVILGFAANGLECAGWPGWAHWLYGAVNVIWAFFFNKAQHRKRQYGP